MKLFVDVGLYLAHTLVFNMEYAISSVTVRPQTAKIAYAARSFCILIAFRETGEPLCG